MLPVKIYVYCLLQISFRNGNMVRTGKRRSHWKFCVFTEKIVALLERVLIGFIGEHCATAQTNDHFKMF